jgi:hypothetical protein
MFAFAMAMADKPAGQARQPSPPCRGEPQSAISHIYKGMQFFKQQPRFRMTRSELRSHLALLQQVFGSAFSSAGDAGAPRRLGPGFTDEVPSVFVKGLRTNNWPAFPEDFCDQRQRPVSRVLSPL